MIKIYLFPQIILDTPHTNQILEEKFCLSLSLSMSLSFSLSHTLTHKCAYQHILTIPQTQNEK